MEGNRVGAEDIAKPLRREGDAADDLARAERTEREHGIDGRRRRRHGRSGKRRGARGAREKLGRPERPYRAEGAERGKTVLHGVAAARVRGGHAVGSLDTNIEATGCGRVTNSKSSVVA